MSSRSSTWETRRVPVSFNASSDRIQLVAGTTPVPGYPAAATSAGRSSAIRSGTVSSSPAMVVSTRCGQVEKFSGAVLGRCVSRP